MALIKDFFSPVMGETLTGCYWKIDPRSGISGGKNMLNCRIVCFRSKQIADTNRNALGSITFQFVPDLYEGAGNFITQAYCFAKSLPEFVGEVDE